MLRAVVRFAIRFRGIVIALAAALLGYGAYSLYQARYDVFPEFAPPEVSVQTEAPGLSPEQVETLVTQPLENAIDGVPGIDSLRSRSIQGLSVITVIFQAGTDVYRDRQVVSERLAAEAGVLPRGVHAPLLTPLTSSTSTIMQVGFESSRMSLMNLRTIADWAIKPQLLAVRGVAGVEVYGGEVRQVQFQFEPQELVRYGVSVDQLVAAASQATGVRGAGFIETANQRLVLRTQGQSVTPAELAATVLVRHDGANVTLGDVTRVVDAPAPAIGAATIGGRPAIVLIIDSAYGANTLGVTRGVDAALADMAPSLTAQGIRVHPEVFRAADFINTALANIRRSLAAGAALVVLVLFLFLFNAGTAAISCVAIPLSLLAAVVVLEKMGMSVNTMTLGGLSIAIGEVVDDAVIDVENIYRRLRENRATEKPRSSARVVLDASLEVRSAVVYATFAVVLVFVPVLGMSGLAGRFFAPLGIAYILAILASLGVALTVTPALCLLALGRGELRSQEPPLVRWLKRGYRSALLRIERAPLAVMAAVSVVIAGGVAALFFLSSSFLPELREGNVTVHMIASPGTSLEESLRLGGRVTQALERVPYVVSVAQRAGRAELGVDTMGANESEIEVNIHAKTGAQVALAQADIRRTIAGFPGAAFSSNTYLTERINETLSGFASPVVINIFGNNLDALDQEGREVARVLGEIRGVSQVQMQSQPGMPQIAVRLRPAALARWGFDPVQVLDAAQTAFGGEVVGQIYRGTRVFDVAVILAPGDRAAAGDIGELPLRSPDGNYVRLGQLADIAMSAGRYQILHQGARRVQTITCNVQGRPVETVVNQARRRIAALRFPAGTYVSFAGAAEAQAKARHELIVESLLAGLGIVLLLSVAMGGWRNLLLVMANLPFALVGGVFAAWLSGGDLSLGSLVGFVTLFGITLRNSIMLISHYQHLVGEEGMSWGLEAALRGASERLAPILMTALVTGLGLLPLALGSGDPGREIEGPMAIVILGGLTTSTALSLLVLPALSLRFARFHPRSELNARGVLPMSPAGR